MTTNLMYFFRYLLLFCKHCLLSQNQLGGMILPADPNIVLIVLVASTRSSVSVQTVIFSKEI